MTTIFTNPNNRVFYACMGVFYVERQTTNSGGDKLPEDGKFLNGVQSVGVDYTSDRTSMLDVGRAQRKYGTYGKQEFTITIERVVNVASVDGSGDNQGITTFFYNVDGNTSYTDTHILKSTNLGFDGFGNSLRNYDIVLIYAPDTFERLGSATSGSDPDKNKYMATQYRCCLLTGISYTIPVDGMITETLTFTTRVANQVDVSSKNWTHLHEPSNDQSGETIRRHDIDTTNSLLPLEVRRLFDLGNSENDIPIFGLQSIEIGATINYSDIMDVGQWRGSNLTGSADSATGEPAGSTALRAQQNLFRQVIFPIEVTCNFTGVVRSQYRGQPTGSVSWETTSTKYQDFENTDTVFAASDGYEDKTLGTGQKSYYEANREILIAALKGSQYYQWNLGKRNYLTDISYNGGDTGGSNVEATLSYKNDVSDFVVMKNASIVDISPSNYDNGLPIYY